MRVGAKAIVALMLMGLVWSSVAAAPSSANDAPAPAPAPIATLAMPSPGGLALDRLTGRLVVSGNADGVVRVVDAASWSVAAEVATNVAGQTLVQMFPERGRAYVVGREPIVNVIDIGAGSLAAQIPMSPEDLNASGTVISQADVPLLLVSFAPGASPGAIALVSTETNFRRGTAVLPYETAALAIPKDRLMLIASNPASGTVLFLDTFFVPFEEIAVGGAPARIVTSADGSRIYVSNPVTGRIDVIDTDLLTLVGSIDVGVGVADFALSPNGVGLSALIPTTGEVVNVDLTTARVVSRGRIGVEPVAITYSLDDRVVYVADKGGNALLAVDLIHELPAAPTNVRVKVGDKSARISWSKPASEGTSPVLRYRVTTLPKAGSCVTRRTSCTVQGLKPGKAYRFQVVAETGVGASTAAVSKPARIPRP